MTQKQVFAGLMYHNVKTANIGCTTQSGRKYILFFENYAEKRTISLDIVQDSIYYQ